jgi:Domain of unknown function (DUF4160)
VPTISWFYGIAIRMYFLDHPPPHFEAVYGEHEANVAIASGEVIAGRLPQTAASLDARPPVRIAGELGSRTC